MTIEEFIAGAATNGIITRREALQRLALLGLSAVSTAALLAACSDGNGDQTGDADPQIQGETDDAVVTFAGPRGELRSVYAPAPLPKGRC